MVNIIGIKTNKYSKLSRLLDEKGYYSRAKFKNLLKKSSRDSDFNVVEAILKDCNGSQKDVLELIGTHFNLPVTELKERVISTQVLNLIPKDLAEQNSVIIFKKTGDDLHVATTALENQFIIDFIKKKTGYEPIIYLTYPQDIKFALQKYKSEISEEFSKIIQASTKEALAVHDSAEKMAQFVPIIKMVNTIIERALVQNVSDIHIQPASNKITLRFRMDGLLHKVTDLPKEILAPLVARIKIISNLKIDTHNIPQDGRFSFDFNEREVAIRVSIIPTLHGQKIVLRLLDMEQEKFTLRKLGLNNIDYQILKKEIEEPNGLILVTGPTGSGKTTTLYTLIHMLNRENINICTIEDPIEYGIDGVNQTQINNRAGLSFVTGLRSLLRQDPDVLMVGEIRDAETALISVNAAMTGHMVLSTLHTNSSFLAPQRLIEMGLPDYLVSTVSNIFIAQRLVRKICLGCKKKIHPNTKSKMLESYDKLFQINKSFEKFHSLGLLNKNQTSLDSIDFYYGAGCLTCNNTGYRGRIGIYEIIKVDKEIEDLILIGADPSKIKDEATKNGTLTMIEDGFLKILNGRTTFEEVMRLTKE